MYLLGFPLLLISFAIYNIVTFVLVLPDTVWTSQAIAVPMTSGEIFKLTWEDILIAGSILLLWVEIIKSTHIGVRAIIDHVLSMLLFVAMLVEFLLVKSAGTSTFFLLLVISLIDVLAGFIIGIRGAARQVEVESAAKT
ncbi:MAG TPA: hypothetical protein VMF12_08300 [Xanthobacteraceae bacterium]|nr:hypothetical protein [Xanthobacteraceae bacterium]